MKINLPNKISIARICMIPIFVVVFFLPFTGNYIAAAAIFALAAATDFVDGYIARKYNLVTNLGKFLDPIADKVLVATAFILMLTAKENLFGAFGGYSEVIYVGVAVSICLILARELIISAFRQIAAANNVILAAEKLGKYKTVCQDACIVILLAAADFVGTAGVVLSWVGLLIFAIATILTVVSGVSYVVNNKQVLKDA